jgi:uncharacterized protein
MKVIVAGGTGLIGRRLVRRLEEAGHEAIVLTRRPKEPRDRQWDGRRGVGPWTREVAGADAVVNLAGESVGTRPWTRRRRKAILESRVDTTRALVEAIAALPSEDRPPVLLNASGIDFAGDPGDRVVTEAVKPGPTFLSFVCQQWECAARAAAPLGVRVVLVRIPFVLAAEAPALKLLSFPFRLGLGGRLGRGDQWFPWIHVDDLCSVIVHAIIRGRLSGPVNAVAPDLRRQRDAAQAIATTLHRPSFFRTPAAVIRVLLGRRADLLLHGQRAVTQKLDAGLFRFPRMDAALADSLR